MHRIEVDFLSDRRPRAYTPRANSYLPDPHPVNPLAFLSELTTLLRDPSILAAVSLPGLSMVATAYLIGTGLSLSAQEQQLRGEIAQLEPVTQESNNLQTRLLQARGETRDLDEVFRSAQSWNGLLANLAQRTPDGVQILKVQEDKGVLSLQGRASRYPEVVALLRNLRGASFLDPKARLVIDSAREIVQDYRPEGTPAEVPNVKAVYVEFSITGRLSSPFPVAPRS